MTRRDMMSLAGSMPALLAAAGPRRAAAQELTSRMGVAATAFSQRRRYERETGSAESISDPLRFLEYCHEIGAGGIQTSLSSMGGSGAKQLRRKAERYGMYVEASVGLPRGDTDLSRFQKDVRQARNAGASVIRTAMLSGRRYETFDSAEAFRQFETQSWNSLTSAEPILTKNRMRLAIENHKDWRIDEMLALLKRISSESVGVCVDTGNNVALLEDPIDVVQALAPHAYSCHLKDMAVKEYEEGFLLSEVVFGEGYLDLKRIVRILRQAQPSLQFSLEMITRDPLEVPCLTEQYWAPLPKLPGRDLVRTLRTVSAKQKTGPLPTVSNLSPRQRVEVEDENNRRCLAYAREYLGL